VAEHSLTTCHRIDFYGASKLGTTTRCMDRLVREAIEIRLHPDYFNLSYAWRSIIKTLQSSKSAPMANQGGTQVENQPRPRVTEKDYINDHGRHIHTSYPDDNDRDGHRNVGILRIPNAADSPRRLQVL
jgi:hypothetical protein